MLERFTVTNRRNQSFVFEMEENESGYQIADIQGLDPVQATLVSTGFAGVDGEQPQSAKRGVRDIQIKIDLEPNGVDNVTTLRQQLYTYFMTKAQIGLRFRQSTGLELDISGTVESFECPLFEQSTQADISVRCFQPDFIDTRVVTHEGMTVSDSTNTNIEYLGNVETGVLLRLYVNRALPAFSMYNRGEDNVLAQLDFSYPLQDGDVLEISSIKNAKGILLTRGGVTTSVLYGRSSQSGWIELFEGNNQFRVYAPGDPIPYELEYTVRYGGL